MPLLPRSRPPGARAFTLVELLAAMAVTSVLLLVVFQMVSFTGSINKKMSEESDSFESARAVFQTLTSQLGQATTRTYLEYFNVAGQTEGQFRAANPTGSFLPAAFGRQSELHFISGPGLLTTDTLPTHGQYTHAVFFQCPLRYSAVANYAALDGLLNSTGFFIEFGTDARTVNAPPAFLAAQPAFQPKYRFRLMTFSKQTENATAQEQAASVYAYPGPGTANSSTTESSWFVEPIRDNHAAYVRVLADNIIALVIWPKATDKANDTLSTDYKYDSRNQGVPWHPPAAQPASMNQMPPILNVAIVALDESSAQRLQAASDHPPAVITQALAGAFTNPAQMQSDLDALSTALTTAHLKFRIFSTTLAISGAKFSAQ